jgi:hypothetical protein
MKGNYSLLVSLSRETSAELSRTTALYLYNGREILSNAQVCVSMTRLVVAPSSNNLPRMRHAPVFIQKFIS